MSCCEHYPDCPDCFFTARVVEANRPSSAAQSGPIDESADALGWGISGELAFDDDNNPAKQVHNHIKIVNDLAKRVKEEIQSLVGMNADLKWEKAKAEVTAKAYCTELLTTKKNNATKKMRAQLCRWRNRRLAKGFATWIYWHTMLAKETVRKKRTLLEEDVRMLADERDRLERAFQVMSAQKDAQEARADMFAGLLGKSVRAKVDLSSAAPAGMYNTSTQPAASNHQSGPGGYSGGGSNGGLSQGYGGGGGNGGGVGFSSGGAGMSQTDLSAGKTSMSSSGAAAGQQAVDKMIEKGADVTDVANVVKNTALAHGASTNDAIEVSAKAAAHTAAAQQVVHTCTFV